MNTEDVSIPDGSWYCFDSSWSVSSGETIDFEGKIETGTVDDLRLRLNQDGVTLAETREYSQSNNDRPNTVLFYRGLVSSDSTFEFCVYQSEDGTQSVGAGRI